MRPQVPTGLRRAPTGQPLAPEVHYPASEVLPTVPEHQPPAPEDQPPAPEDQPPAHEVQPPKKVFFSVFDDRLLSLLLCLFSVVIRATIFLNKVVKNCSMLQILMIF